jgi:hypothetical protein
MPLLLKKRHLPTAIIVGLFLTVNITFLAWNLSFLRGAKDLKVLRYGQPIPKLAGNSLAGDRNVEFTPDRLNLVIYLTSVQLKSRSVELAKYAEILRQRYGKQGLKVAAVVRGDIPELGSLASYSMIGYDVIRDDSGKLGEKLGLGGSHNGVFFFGGDGKCLLCTDVPVRAEDLRQFVAVEMLHVSPFDKSVRNQRIIEEGQPLGSWVLSDARSWEQTSLGEVSARAPGFFIFFTAECSVCSLPDYLKSYAEFERQRKSQPGTPQAATLVFDFNFSRTDVLDQLLQFKIDTPAYIANEELTAISDLGRLKSFDNGQVVAAEVDGGGTIIKLSSFDALRAESRSAAESAELSRPARSAQPAVAPEKPRAAFEEMFHAVPLAAYDIASHGGEYFVTDSEGNRILVFGADGRLRREIGKIGSGPGRLLHPGYIDIGSDGTIYVQDGGNHRVERFSADGTYLGDFPMGDYEGFAIGSRGEIYLGRPEAGALVTAYSNTGQPLRSFGRLKKYSDVYGPQSADKDEAYKIAFNRVRLTTDREGNVYVSFLLAPLLQKYSPDGTLLFERNLEGDKIDFLKKVLETQKYLSTGRDGVEARTITLDPVVDPATGNILVMLVDGSVYVADRDGRRISIVYEQTDQRLKPFYPFMAGLGVNGEVIVVPFQQKRCYRLVPPAFLARKAEAGSAS